MPYLNGKISSNIYYTSVGSEVLRLARSTSDINVFVTLSNCLLKRIQEKGSKHRSMISMLNKIFGKDSTIFSVFADTAANFIKPSSLPWNRTIHIHVYLLQNLFLLFAFLVVCLLVCLSKYHVIIASMPSIFVSKYLHLCIFLFVGILYYNFTLIQYFLETDISVFNVILSIYYVLLFIDLLVNACIIMYIFLHFFLQIMYSICVLFSLFFVCLRVDHDFINALLYLCPFLYIYAMFIYKYIYSLWLYLIEYNTSS